MKLSGPLALAVAASAVAVGALKVHGGDPALGGFAGQIPAGWHIAGYANSPKVAGPSPLNAAPAQSAFEAAQAEAQREVAAAAAEEQAPQQARAPQAQTPPSAPAGDPWAGLPIPPGFQVASAVDSAPQVPPGQGPPPQAQTGRASASAPSVVANAAAGLAIPQGWSMPSTAGSGNAGVSIPPGWAAAPIKSFAGSAPRAMPKVQSVPSFPMAFNAGPSTVEPPAPHLAHKGGAAPTVPSRISSIPAGISIPQGWAMQSSTGDGKAAASVPIPPGWSAAPVASFGGVAPSAMPKVESSTLSSNEFESVAHSAPMAPHPTREQAQAASAIRSARAERTRAQNLAATAARSNAARAAIVKTAKQASAQRARNLRLPPGPHPQSNAHRDDGLLSSPEALAPVMNEEDAADDDDDDADMSRMHKEGDDRDDSADEVFRALPAEKRMEEPPDGYVPVGGVALATPLEGDGPSGEWREQAAPAAGSTVPIIAPDTLRGVTSVECLTQMLNHPGEPCGDDVPAADDPPFPEVRPAHVGKLAAEPAAEPTAAPAAELAAKGLMADKSPESQPLQKEPPAKTQAPATPLWPTEDDAGRLQAAEKRPETVEELGKKVKVVYHKKPVRKQHGHSHLA